VLFGQRTEVGQDVHARPVMECAIDRDTEELFRHRTGRGHPESDACGGAFPAHWR
jgi:hypothetical protein